MSDEFIPNIDRDNFSIYRPLDRGEKLIWHRIHLYHSIEYYTEDAPNITAWYLGDDEFKNHGEWCDRHVLGGITLYIFGAYGKPQHYRNTKFLSQLDGQSVGITATDDEGAVRWVAHGARAGMDQRFEVWTNDDALFINDLTSIMLTFPEFPDADRFD